MIDDQIGAKTDFQMNGFVNYRNRLLANNRAAAFFEFVSENRFVNRL